MRNKNKFVEFTAIVVLIIFSLMACDNGTMDNDKTPSEITIVGTTLANKLDWLNTNVASNTAYLITVDANESLAPQTFSYTDKINISIRLQGNKGERTISLSSFGSLFTVNKGVTLVLDKNITLRGGTNNTAALVTINSGTLVMKAEAEITSNDNTNTSDYHGENSRGNGGGVYVSGGTFTMKGGKISNNTARYSGGGVYVIYNGTFSMEGGEIFGNTSFDGGGVSVHNDASFVMSGGAISGNIGNGGGAGGVGILGGTFTMNGGEISNNTANGGFGFGGGVDVGIGSFTMNGGKISDNTAVHYGGGVYVSDAVFNMNGGEIFNNTADSGGGVYVYMGTFEIKGGEILRNTAFYYGGGIYMGNDATFTKLGGGIITGYVDSVNGNVVKNSYGTVQNNRGHTVYINSSPVKRRESTAGSMVSLDSTKDGADGGWEN
jgi:predicted outer membrane repeat protein